MSHFLCKLVPHLKHSISTHSKFHRLFFVQCSSLQVEAGIPISENGNRDSFTVKYFIDKCGVSLYKAVSASKYVTFDKPDKPDAFFSFLKNHGFTDIQLFKMVRKCPGLIACDPETLLPKIEFLHSKGFREKEISALFVSHPYFLLRSLEEHLVPTFDLLKDYLGSVETTVKSIILCPRILPLFQSRVLPNIHLLKAAGVPNSCIAFGLRSEPRLFAFSCNKIHELVEDIKKMGIEPDSNIFMRGIFTKGLCSELLWKNKLEVYKRWDCTEDEVLMVFKNDPCCMRLSVAKIDSVMDFFVNEVGWRPQMVLLRPQLFTLSLQMRIVPRCSVYKVLLSKGLLKVKGSLYSILKYSEDKFLEKFVSCYPGEAPELLRLYKEIMGISRKKIRPNGIGHVSKSHRN